MNVSPGDRYERGMEEWGGAAFLELLSSATERQMKGGKSLPIEQVSSGSAIRCHAELMPNWGSVCQHRESPNAL